MQLSVKIQFFNKQHNIRRDKPNSIKSEFTKHRNWEKKAKRKNKAKFLFHKDKILKQQMRIKL